MILFLILIILIIIKIKIIITLLQFTVLCVYVNSEGTLNPFSILHNIIL
jgi:hypothetical protein